MRRVHVISVFIRLYLSFNCGLPLSLSLSLYRFEWMLTTGGFNCFNCVAISDRTAVCFIAAFFPIHIDAIRQVSWFASFCSDEMIVRAIFV